MVSPRAVVSPKGSAQPKGQCSAQGHGSGSQSFPHIKKVSASHIRITGPGVCSKQPQGLSLVPPALHRDRAGKDVLSLQRAGERRPFHTLLPKLPAQQCALRCQGQSKCKHKAPHEFGFQNFPNRCWVHYQGVHYLGWPPGDVGLRSRNWSAVPGVSSYV